MGDRPLSMAEMRALGLSMEDIEEAMICINDYAARESDRASKARAEPEKNATEDWISKVGGSKIPMDKKDIPGVAKKTFSIEKGNSFDSIDQSDASNDEAMVPGGNMKQEASSSFQSKRKKRLSDSGEDLVDTSRNMRPFSSSFGQKRTNRLSDPDSDEPATPGNMKHEHKSSSQKKKKKVLDDSDDSDNQPIIRKRVVNQKQSDGGGASSSQVTSKQTLVVLDDSDDSDDQPIYRKSTMKQKQSDGGGASSSKFTFGNTVEQKCDGKKKSAKKSSETPWYLDTPSFTPSFTPPRAVATAEVDKGSDSDNFALRLHDALCNVEPAEDELKLVVAGTPESPDDDNDKIPAYTRKCSTCGSGSHTRKTCDTEETCCICLDIAPLKQMLWCGGSLSNMLSGVDMANRNSDHAPHFVCIDCAVGKQGGYNVMLEKGNTILEMKDFIRNIEKKNPMIPCSYPKCNLYCDMKILLPKFAKKSEDGIKLREIVSTMQGMVVRKRVEDVMNDNGLVHKGANPVSHSKNTPKSYADEIVAVHCPWGCGACMDIDADGCASLTCLICKQHMCILCHVGVKCPAHMKSWGVAINSGDKDQLRMTNMCVRCNDACHVHIKTCPLLLPGEKGTFWPPESAKKRVYHDFVKKNIQRVVRQLDTIELKMQFWKELQPSHKIGSLQDYFE
jgi:hypothetical protein